MGTLVHFSDRVDQIPILHIILSEHKYSHFTTDNFISYKNLRQEL
jgi:hypothetical protein